MKCFKCSVHLPSVTDTVSKQEAAAANAAWQLPFVTLSTAAGTTQNITPVRASALAQAICRFYNGCSKLKCITFLPEQVNESEKGASSAREKSVSPVDGRVGQTQAPTRCRKSESDRAGQIVLKVAVIHHELFKA